jgi:hypothetical protein
MDKKISKKLRVFLAHNSQDKDQVKTIASILNQKGIDTWLDEEQIHLGVSFQEYIQKAIKDIDCALIFIGKKGVGHWQKWEIRSFFTKLVESQIPVIPILLPGVQVIPDNLNFLNEINYVKFPDDIRDQSTINKIIWGITRNSNQINYDVLNGCLNAGLWREANRETRKIILQSANQEKDGFLSKEQIRDFDSDILIQLDDLWKKYSNNHFGFSVQKKILKDCHKDAVKFGIQVGWRRPDRKHNNWIDEATAIYSLNSPLGHLPYGMLQLVNMNNAIVEGIVNAQWATTKILVTQDWQRQLISDAVGVFEFVGGNRNFDSGEFKKGLDFQLKHDEAWWEGERAEKMKIEELSLFLFSCSQLDS